MISDHFKPVFILCLASLALSDDQYILEDFMGPEWIELPQIEESEYDQSKGQLTRLLSTYVGHQPQESIIHANKRVDSQSDDLVLGRYRNPFMKHFGWQAAIIGVVGCIAGVFVIAIFTTAVIRHRRTSGKKMSPQSMLNRVTGSTRSTSPHESMIGFDAGDKKLAHSAQMYHYQHQKQQMLAMERASNQITDRFSDEDLVNHDSDQEADDDVDFAVFECPGLAPAGDLEVKNPLFQGMDRTTPSDELSPCSGSSSTELSPNFTVLDADRDDLTPTLGKN